MDLSFAGGDMKDSPTRWVRATVVPSVMTGAIVHASSVLYGGAWGEPSALAISVVAGVSAFVSYRLYDRIGR